MTPTWWALLTAVATWLKIAFSSAGLSRCAPAAAWASVFASSSGSASSRSVIAGRGGEPSAAAKPKSYEGWSRDLAAWLYGQRRLELLRDPASGAVSRPSESERDFRVRIREASRAERDERVEALRKKYAPKRAALEERLRRAQQSETREREQVSQQGVQAAISIGATILGAVLGRKTVSVGNIGRATTAARGSDPPCGLSVPERIRDP